MICLTHRRAVVPPLEPKPSPPYCPECGRTIKHWDGCRYGPGPVLPESENPDA